MKQAKAKPTEGTKVEIPCCVQNDCSPNDFEFDLLQDVEIDASKESGMIIARAEYATSENSYLIRYAAHDGRAVEAWWNESALSAI